MLVFLMTFVKRLLRIWWFMSVFVMFVQVYHDIMSEAHFFCSNIRIIIIIISEIT